MSPRVTNALLALHFSSCAALVLPCFWFEWWPAVTLGILGMIWLIVGWAWISIAEDRWRYSQSTEAILDELRAREEEARIAEQTLPPAEYRVWLSMRVAENRLRRLERYRRSQMELAEVDR